MLRGVFVDVALSLMRALVDSVLHGVAGRAQTGRCADIGVFGNSIGLTISASRCMENQYEICKHSLFVGLFAGLVGMALGLVGDPVAGVSERVHFDGWWSGDKLGCYGVLGGVVEDIDILSFGD